MQVADDIASEIERQIRETSSKVEAFISSQSHELARVQGEHETAMRELEAKIQRLKADHSAVGSRYESLQSQLQAGKLRLEEKQRELASLEASASSLPAEVETTRAKEEAAQKQYSGAKLGEIYLPFPIHTHFPCSFL